MSKQNSYIGMTTMKYQATNLGDISVGTMIGGMITRLEIRECRVTASICPLLTVRPWGKLLA